MGYQALLYCPDERLARVVTQVFTELDFHVEPVNEPFSAVKKLMSQRYDALVVDCENEQNATLLFKSARNSTSNQNSLALALVEGQAGVAKAYRIGANLVLTKPINVEQAKGTLRVARGLLRKNADAANAHPASSTTTNAAPPSVKPAAPPAPPKIEFRSAPAPQPPAKPKFEMPEFETPLPAMAASAEVEQDEPLEQPEFEPAMPAEIQAKTAEIAPPPQPASKVSPIKPTVQKPAVPVSSQGAAAAPAQAKETLAPQIAPPVGKAAPTIKRELPEFDPVESRPVRSSVPEIAAPTFSALEEPETSEGGGSKNKILAIVAVMIVAVALAYIASGKFGKSTPAAQPHNAAPVATAPAPTPSAPTAENSSESSAPANETVANTVTKPSPKVSPITTADSSKALETPEIVVKTIAPPPIKVKPDSGSPRPRVQQEEAASAAPSPMALATGNANDKNLNGLVPSEAAIPRPAGALKISQGVSQGLLIKRVQPIYPPNALAMRIQGTVEMEATINKEGNITNLKKISGDPILSRAALEAVKQWRYKPYYLDGQPVDIQTQIAIKFKLPD
jgi:protein TonB